MSAPLDDEALDLIFREARTFNHYLDKPVAQETLRAVWDLARFGPTSANQSPARIVWCVSDDAKERLAVHASDSNGAKIRAAPVTAILGMDMEFYEHLPRLFPHADARSWFLGNDQLIATSAMRNSTLQGAYLIIAARALGLGVGPMSGFDNAKVDEAFFAGTAIKSNFIMTMGYGDPARLHARLPRFSFDDVNTIA